MKDKASVKPTPIVHTAVKSEMVESVGYCPERSCIELKFRSGGVYRYHDCTPEEYQAMRSANSIGKWTHQNLKGKKWSKVG